MKPQQIDEITLGVSASVDNEGVVNAIGGVLLQSSGQGRFQIVGSLQGDSVA